jgi:Skp family chaperone for outer membrane proteins
MRRLVLALTAAALLAAPRAVEAADPVPIAVVDILKCVNAHPGLRKAAADIATREAEAVAARDRGLEDMKAIAKDLELDTQKDSPGYQDKVKQFERRKAQVDFEWKWSIRVAQEEYVRALIGVYEQVKGLVAKYARDNRILLVLQMTDEKLQAKDRADFTANVVVRSVPYYDTSLDITSKVIAMLPPAPPAVGAPPK